MEKKKKKEKSLFTGFVPPGYQLKSVLGLFELEKEAQL